MKSLFCRIYRSSQLEYVNVISHDLTNFTFAQKHRKLTEYQHAQTHNNMAPNLKRTQLLLQSFDLDLVQPAKAAFPPLTSETAQQEQPAKNAVAAQQDSSDYWEWSVEDDAEINKIVDEERLSADHIVDNIMRQPAVAASSSTTIAANDQYWDWSHGSEESKDYWNWPASSNNVRQEGVKDSDSYWAW